MKIRQGDVLIELSKVPEGSKKLDHLILAHGEVTGHKHQVVEGEADLYESEGVLYLSVKSETAVIGHEEHKAQTLPQGDYKIMIQKEYEPGGWRNVAD